MSRQILVHTVFIIFVVTLTLAQNPKYFWESEYSYHLDKEYGKRMVPQEEIEKELYNLLVHLSWISKKQCVRPIIIAGCMIGAYYGNKPLPWDDDCDIAFLEEDFKQLQPFETPAFVFKINPHWKTRENDPDNRIDARLISKTNGQFIDIVALTQSTNNVLHQKRDDIPPFLKSNLLPLQNTSFWGISGYFLPNKITKVIEKYYKNGLKRVYRHKKDLWVFDSRDQTWKKTS